MPGKTNLQKYLEAYQTCSGGNTVIDPVTLQCVSGQRAIDLRHLATQATLANRKVSGAAINEMIAMGYKPMDISALVHALLNKPPKLKTQHDIEDAVERCKKNGKYIEPISLECVDGGTLAQHRALLAYYASENKDTAIQRFRELAAKWGYNEKDYTKLMTAMIPTQGTEGWESIVKASKAIASKNGKTSSPSKVKAITTSSSPRSKVVAMPTSTTAATTNNKSTLRVVHKRKQSPKAASQIVDTKKKQTQHERSSPPTPTLLPLTLLPMQVQAPELKRKVSPPKKKAIVDRSSPITPTLSPVHTAKKRTPSSSTSTGQKPDWYWERGPLLTDFINDWDACGIEGKLINPKTRRCISGKSANALAKRAADAMKDKVAKENLCKDLAQWGYDSDSFDTIIRLLAPRSAKDYSKKQSECGDAVVDPMTLDCASKTRAAELQRRARAAVDGTEKKLKKYPFEEDLTAWGYDKNSRKAIIKALLAKNGKETSNEDIKKCKQEVAKLRTKYRQAKKDLKDSTKQWKSRLTEKIPKSQRLSELMVSIAAKTQYPQSIQTATQNAAKFLMQENPTIEKEMLNALDSKLKS